MQTPFLSVIIPAFNEEQRLPKTLEQVLVYLKDQPYRSEILVVENASQDNTFQVAKEFAQTHNSEDLPIQVIREPNRGKGSAVKRGMYRLMVNIDSCVMQTFRCR